MVNVELTFNGVGIGYLVRWAGLKSFKYSKIIQAQGRRVGTRTRGAGGRLDTGN